MAESSHKQPDENEAHATRPSLSEWEQKLAEAAEIDRHRTGPPYAMTEIWSTKGMLPEGFVPTSIYDYPLSVWWRTEEGKAAAERLRQEEERENLRIQSYWDNPEESKVLDDGLLWADDANYVYPDDVNLPPTHQPKKDQ